jgi:hypothetical protein
MYDQLGREGMEQMEQEGGAAGGPWGQGGFAYGFGSAGGGPFSPQDIFEQLFGQGSSGGNYGQFFSGAMFVESAMRLSFMVGAVTCGAGACNHGLSNVRQWDDVMHLVQPAVHCPHLLL